MWGGKMEWECAAREAAGEVQRNVLVRTGFSVILGRCFTMEEDWPDIPQQTADGARGGGQADDDGGVNADDSDGDASYEPLVMEDADEEDEEEEEDQEEEEEEDQGEVEGEVDREDIRVLLLNHLYYDEMRVMGAA